MHRRRIRIYTGFHRKNTDSSQEIVACLQFSIINRQSFYHTTLEPLSQSEVSLDDLELPRYKSTVKAICFGLANSANYSDQWSIATLIRRKLHCERGKFFISMLGDAPVSRDFRSVLHLRSIREFMVCQLYVDRAWFQAFYISSELFPIFEDDEPGKQLICSRPIYCAR